MTIDYLCYTIWLRLFSWQKDLVKFPDPNNILSPSTRTSHYEACTLKDKIALDHKILDRLLDDVRLLKYDKTENELRNYGRDEFTKGLQEFLTTKDIPVWLVFATQVMCDIRWILGHKVVDCHGELLKTANDIYSELSRQFKLVLEGKIAPLRSETMELSNDLVVYALRDYFSGGNFRHHGKLHRTRKVLSVIEMPDHELLQPLQPSQSEENTLAENKSEYPSEAVGAHTTPSLQHYRVKSYVEEKTTRKYVEAFSYLRRNPYSLSPTIRHFLTATASGEMDELLSELDRLFPDRSDHDSEDRFNPSLEESDRQMEMTPIAQDWKTSELRNVQLLQVMTRHIRKEWKILNMDYHTLSATCKGLTKMMENTFPALNNWKMEVHMEFDELMDYLRKDRIVRGGITEILGNIFVGVKKSEGSLMIEKTRQFLRKPHKITCSEMEEMIRRFRKKSLHHQVPPKDARPPLRCSLAAVAKASNH
ncbi:hypothetical protein NHQ30_002514 [Ciborinia camelliae]|nr:hypothetical protein NHQ30_002514 [Ciborinia camelliae]